MDPQVLKTALTTLETKLADALANPKPNYSVEGQSVSWGEYIKMLQEAYKTTLELLNYLQPFELRSSIL